MPRSMQKVDDLYHQAACTPSDIWEHVPVLMRLGRMCDEITEFGTRTGVSTAAFLKAEPRVLTSYDVLRHTEVDMIEDAARDAGISFSFRQEDVTAIDIAETDLLFIDTRHTFTQMRTELSRHGHKVRRFIVMHDTVTFGSRGEVPGDPGIMVAIRTYFDARIRDWKLIDHLPNNNGLSIYMRRWRRV